VLDHPELLAVDAQRIDREARPPVGDLQRGQRLGIARSARSRGVRKQRRESPQCLGLRARQREQGADVARRAS
jgi:hypothetical protein